MQATYSQNDKASTQCQPALRPGGREGREKELQEGRSPLWVTTDDFWESDTPYANLGGSISQHGKACVPLAASQVVAEEAQVIPVALHSKYPLCESQGRCQAGRGCTHSCGGTGAWASSWECLRVPRAPIEPELQVKPVPSRPLVDCEQ